MRALVFTFLLLFITTTAHAQREREIQPAEESQYSRKFFMQLRGVFGRFRDTDLHRAFDRAQPIQCSELINDKGEWRTVAFFNEKRELGDWYRSSFDEVKRDLAVFIFRGVCRGEHVPVQLTTKFPVTERVELFNAGRIGLEEVDVNVNAPVRASFDAQTNAYTFDLPYLFLISQQDDERLYSLAPPRLVDRDKYATDVIDHWECKSVTAENVTYQFLLCRTSTVPRNASARNQVRAAFGASAFFILSDGKEASSNVKLTFGDSTTEQHNVEDLSPPAELNRTLSDGNDRGPWDVPEPDERLADIQRDEFRIRFAAQAWNSRIGNAQLLSGHQISNLGSSSSATTGDSCVWLPGAPALVRQLLADESAESIVYSMKLHDQDLQGSTSITFDMRTRNGTHLGSLECFFPRAPSAAGVQFSRWTAIAGENLVLEVR